MKRYEVTAHAIVEIVIEVEANSPVEAMVKAEGMRPAFVDAVHTATIVNIELHGAKPLP